MKKTFSIGKLAKISGVTAQTLRYYETRGLLTPLGRNSSGYRIYDEKALKKLRFIGWAKELGFALEEIKDILSLQGKGPVTCEWMRDKASEKMALVQDQVSVLISVIDALQDFVAFCESQPATDECPVLKDVEYPVPWDTEREQRHERKSTSRKPPACGLLSRRA